MPLYVGQQMDVYVEARLWNQVFRRRRLTRSTVVSVAIETMSRLALVWSAQASVELQRSDECQQLSRMTVTARARSRSQVSTVRGRALRRVGPRRGRGPASGRSLPVGENILRGRCFSRLAGCTVGPDYTPSTGRATGVPLGRRGRSRVLSGKRRARGSEPVVVVSGGSVARFAGGSRGGIKPGSQDRGEPDPRGTGPARRGCGCRIALARLRWFLHTEQEQRELGGTTGGHRELAGELGIGPVPGRVRRELGT